MQLNLFETYEEPCEAGPVLALVIDVEAEHAAMQAWLLRPTDANATARLRLLDEVARQQNPHIAEHRRSWWPHYPA